MDFWILLYTPHALVFDLGVETISVADGGYVVACDGVGCVNVGVSVGDCLLCFSWCVIGWDGMGSIVVQSGRC